MKKGRLSVVIPAYNEEQMIERTRGAIAKMILYMAM